MSGVYESGKRLDGWCCSVCHAGFDHSPRHRVAQPLRAFLRLIAHKTTHLHRPFSYRIRYMPCTHITMPPAMTWSTSAATTVTYYFDWSVR